MNIENWDRELFFKKHGHAGGFVTQLFELIAKADSSNRALISKGFPEAVAAWERWYHAESEDSHWEGLGFFKELGAK